MGALESHVLRGYEFQEQVGAGGFGVVYRAFQPAVGREVAVKVILPHHANHPDFIRRFEYEAQFVARLEHPHIVPLYDYWRQPDSAYLVMRWLPNSLRHLLSERGAWAVEDTAQLLDQITSALAVAHRQGVVHRDIKPDNILLDEDGNAYLADFGIAKDLKAEAITQEDSIVGSPIYLTPEQVKGEPVSPQTDIYSLGVVLYEMLTGEQPFPNLPATSLLMKHLYDPLPPLSALRPELPSALDAVIQKATAKEPARRYREVLELAGAFRVAAQTPRYPEGQVLLGPLTHRELDILRLIAGGMSNQEIAEQLVLSPGTVKWYVKQIFSKLDVHNRSQAIGRAQEILKQIAERKADALAEAQETDSEELSILTEMVRPYGLAAPVIESPYKGLRAFLEADAADFFGREVLIGQLVKRLKENTDYNRFLAVIGPSGSGKSSLVRAGLVSALRRGILPGSSRWFVVEMLPGSHPFEELEAALLRVAVNPPDSLINQLREDDLGLLRAVKRVLPADEGVELVIVIDQLEELFTLVESEQVRARFLNSLAAAVADPRSRVRVISTLRADFTDRPLLYAEFGKLVRQRNELVLPLNPDELKQAITGPAERVGLKVEADLVGEIIREVAAQPGALPLLEYALTELFEAREGNRLTLDHYRASGGALQALARRANDLYEELAPEGKQAARQMFLRLVTLGEGTDDARRRTLHSELVSIVDNPQVMEDVIEVYVQYRLLTLDHDPITRGPTVEVAHEAMLREWKRLRGWLNDNRNNIRKERQLAAGVREWESSGREPSFLLRGVQLEQFETWQSAADLALTAQERAYLDASLAERGLQRARERRGQIALRVLRILVAVAAVIAFILAGVAFSQRQQAIANLDLSEAQRLAAESNRLLVEGGNPDLIALLALQSIHKQYTPQGDQALEGASRLDYSKIFTSAASSTLIVVFSPDGKLIMSAGSDGTIKLWDAQTGQLVREIAASPNVVPAAVFSPDGRMIVSADNIPGDYEMVSAARLWDVQTGKLLREFKGHHGGVRVVAFSPDGRMILTQAKDGIARLWDVDSGELIREFGSQINEPGAVAFSPDGKSVAICEGNDVTVWDVQTGQELRRLSGHTDTLFAIRYSPDGRFIASGSLDTTVRVWDAQTGALLHTLANRDFAITMTFSPDSKVLVTSQTNLHTFSLWDVETGAELRRLVGHTDNVAGLGFSPDGETLATGGGGSIRLWSMHPRDGMPVIAGHTGTVVGLAYSPDGRNVLTGSNDGTARLWDAETGREIRQYGGHTSIVQGTGISPNGKWAVTAGPDSSAHIWDIQTGDLQVTLPRVETLYSVAFSPDGTRVLGAPGDGSAADIWDAVSGKLICKLPGGASSGSVGVFSQDGRMALTAGDGPAHLWDSATCALIRDFKMVGEEVLSVAFSPDSTLAVTGGLDSVRLWDVSTGKEIRRFIGHSDYIWGVAFSPDGKTIATASYDKTARLWDVATGQELRRFVGHKAGLENVIFSPDGRYILTGADDYIARLWYVDLDNVINDLCSRVPRDLTEDERAEYGIPDSGPSCPGFAMNGPN